VILVVLRQRTNTVIGKELVFIEHTLHDLFQSVFADKGQQQSVVLATLAHVCNVAFGHVVAVVNEPVQSTLEVWKLVNDFRLQSESGVQRNQTDQRPNGHLVAPRTTPGDGIVIEAVLVIPEGLLLAVCTVLHSVGDEDEVLEKLGSNVFVSPSVLSQLQSNVQHAKTVEGHPPSGVRLLKHTTSRERIGAVEETNVVETQETTLKDVLAIKVLAVDPPSEVEEQLLEDAL